jgi:hypothetical protein
VAPNLKRGRLVDEPHFVNSSTSVYRRSDCTSFRREKYHEEGSLVEGHILVT